MGTRGLMGFRIDGVDHGHYVHSDAYPDGLGTDVVRGYRQATGKLGLEGVKDRMRHLEVLSQDVKPTPEQIERLKSYANLRVSEQNINDAYCLLHECQGNMLKILESGAILDNMGFIRESLHCEWAYILNFDTMTLEVYRGFQETPHDKGRFAAEQGSTAGYYPCALIAEFPLDAIPENWEKQIEKMAYGEDDES